MQKIIEVRGLSKAFSNNLVLDDVSFDVEEGSVIGLIGRSGCGKTTLLNLLVGYLKPNKGGVYYKGTDVQKSNFDLLRNVGFAVQEGSFYKKLKVSENLNYFGKLYGLTKEEIKDRTSILLENFGLSDASSILGDNLSVGMQKRLDIACALIHDPEVLLLDEPTANLDPVLRKNILWMIKKINETGTTVVLSSHMLEDVSSVCKKVLMINRKKVITFDSPENLEFHFSGFNAIKLQSELGEYTNLISVLTSQGLIKNYKAHNDSLMLFTRDVKSTLKHINHYFSNSNDNLVHIDIVKPSLDTVFENVSNNK